MNVTTEQRAELSPEKKRELLARLLRDKARQPASIPLSFAQQRLWFLDQLQPGTGAYNIPTALRLRGDLDIEALHRTLQAILLRHQVLRTRFECVAESPVQIIAEPERIDLPVVDLTAISDREIEGELQRRLYEEGRKPFNLASDLMLRATLYRVGEHDHVLLLNMHHIAADEWSLRVLFSEMSELYAGYREGRDPVLPALPIQYADFAIWQREKRDVWESQLGYWREQLAGNPPPVELPADRPRPAVQTYAGARESIELGPTLGKRLEGLGRSEEATLFMSLLAGFSVLLARHTRQRDIVIGSPIAGRTRIETEPLIGFFVNTLALRVDTSGTPTFRELVRRAREVCLGAFANQDAPFERIVEELHPERSATHAPFLQVIFALQHDFLDGFELPGLDVDLLDLDTGTAKFDLTVIVKSGRDSLSAVAEFNTDLFDHETIQRLLQHYRILLEHAVSEPDKAACMLPMLSEVEHQKVVREWNATDREYPRDQALAALFEKQVARTPDHIAVVYGRRRLTYRELDNEANRLANHLRTLGVSDGSLVGIGLERSPDMIVAMLAVLKAGGAYVPLDPAYPAERLGFMLKDAGVGVLVTADSFSTKLSSARNGGPTAELRVVSIPLDSKSIRRQPSESPPSSATGASLAYVIYTSGSTGEPKGVAVPQRAVSRLVLNTNYVKLTSEDRIAQASNACFDAATFEIWGALLNGASVIGVPQDVALSPRDFAEHLRKEKVTTLFLTTALFNQIASEVPDAFDSLTTLLFGGEAVEPKWVRHVLNAGPPKRLLHVYGPTETTTFSTWHEIKSVAAGARTIPIGRPLANTQAYVLDEFLQPVPVGVPGELFIGGDGLAREYLKRPALTSERFVADPFNPDPKARLYRTGDLVRLNPNGDIEFLGRLDSQVKLRGFRIELGEVEALLSAHPTVKECAVVLHGDSSAAKRLIAYWRPVIGDGDVSATELRHYVQSKLPEYMVPSRFIRLEKLPLNANGKVDRPALPAPEQLRLDAVGAARAPRDRIEQQLADIWKSVLKLESVGIDEDFFEVGGHSLLAVKLFSQIEKVFETKLPLSALFQSPTIERLADVIRHRKSEGNSLVVPIQPQGERPPFFWIHSLGGDGGGGFFYYRKLSQLLGVDQPSYGIRSPDKPYTRIEEMAAAYVEELKRFQPKGPYFLGGFCFGGVVAFEIARQLESSGESVGLLVLLESIPPNLSGRPMWSFRLIVPFIQNLNHWALDVLQRPGEHWLRLYRKRRVLGQRLARLFMPGRNGIPEIDLRDVIDMSDYPRDYVKYAEAHWQALRHYVPKPCAGRITLFRARKQGLSNFDPSLGWSRLTSVGVSINIIPGTHEKMLEDPNVQILARELKACLVEAQLKSEGENEEQLPKRESRWGNGMRMGDRFSSNGRDRLRETRV